MHLTSPFSSFSRFALTGAIAAATLLPGAAALAEETMYFVEVRGVNARHELSHIEFTFADATVSTNPSTGKIIRTDNGTESMVNYTVVTDQVNQIKFEAGGDQIGKDADEVDTFVITLEGTPTSVNIETKAARWDDTSEFTVTDMTMDGEDVVEGGTMVDDLGFEIKIVRIVSETEFVAYD